MVAAAGPGRRRTPRLDVDEPRGPTLGAMPQSPEALRDEDLRRWRGQRFPDVPPIADLRPRHPASCVGVVHRIRVVPGRRLEVGIEDGSGRLTAVFTGRTNLPGLDLGRGMRLSGTVAVDADGQRRILNPAWSFVEEPYG